jgi:hypothetical protein
VRVSQQAQACVYRRTKEGKKNAVMVHGIHCSVYGRDGERVSGDPTLPPRAAAGLLDQRPSAINRKSSRYGAMQPLRPRHPKGPALEKGTQSRRRNNAIFSFGKAALAGGGHTSGPHPPIPPNGGAR